jgi:hypothetical protein
MMRPHTLLLAAAGLLFVLPALANEAAIPHPSGFRAFRHVKTTVVGKASPIFEREGGIHHFYANEAAVEGYRSGAFPDGAVLVDDLLEAPENGGVTREGPRRRTAVMVKDAARFAETGGWGFEVYRGESREATLDAAARAACFACHAKVKGAVFTTLAD